MIHYGRAMKYYEVLLLAIVSVLAAVHYSSAQEVPFTSIVYSNGSVNMELSMPPREALLMEWSDDLITWHPLHEYVLLDPPGTIIRAMYSADADGIASVPDTPATNELRKFYRATPPPTNFPPYQYVPLKTTK